MIFDFCSYIFDVRKDLQGGEVCKKTLLFKPIEKFPQKKQSQKANSNKNQYCTAVSKTGMDVVSSFGEFALGTE